MQVIILVLNSISFELSKLSHKVTCYSVLMKYTKSFM